MPSFAAIVAMAIVIMLYDQLLFRPLVALGRQFRVELSAGQVEASHGSRDRSRARAGCARLTRPPAQLFQSIALLRLELAAARAPRPRRQTRGSSRVIDILWLIAVAAACSGRAGASSIMCGPSSAGATSGKRRILRFSRFCASSS